MKKVIVLIAISIFVLGGVGTIFAKTFYSQPGKHSSVALCDGNATPYDWELWIDRTNSKLKFSSCRRNGGYPCPSEINDNEIPAFDETQGLTVGP